MRTAWVLALSVAVATARAEDVRTERSQGEQRLAAQRAALALLQAQKGGTLAVLDVYERLARGAESRAQTLAAQVRALRGRLATAEVQEALARSVLEARARRMEPRLWTLDRLTRRSALEVLLPSKDLAALVWRTRALSTLVKGDVAALEEMRAVADLQSASLAELDGLKVSLADRMEVLREESAQAAEQKGELSEALLLLQAKARASSGVLAELARAQTRLDQLVAELDARPETTGFGALRGRLPLPAAGRIEAGFGKVLEPRFNTVTLRRGIDIRAPSGTPVRAVAPGTVAWTGWMRGYGNVVILDHGDGYHSVVAHLQEVMRPLGVHVFEGDVLGTVGDTGSLQGPVLYFEIRRQGLAVDPAPWLGASAYGKAAGTEPPPAKPAEVR
jgi:septal ring factor EnvC (AmiA/AmiB activator)